MPRCKGGPKWQKLFLVISVCLIKKQKVRADIGLFHSISLVQGEAQVLLITLVVVIRHLCEPGRDCELADKPPGPRKCSSQMEYSAIISLINAT